LPVISVLFLDYVELPGTRVHSRFHLLEIADLVRFTDAIEVHVIELPKRDAVSAVEERDDAAVLRWTRFFGAGSDEEIQSLAMADPTMEKACEELERLSASPEARRLAELRERAFVTYRIEMAAARAEGKAEGRAESILDVLAARGIAVSEDARVRICTCTDAPTLARWLSRAVIARSVEEMLAEPTERRGAT
jgi:predicted transposase/invertase (TIGR01784 family)